MPSNQTKNYQLSQWVKTDKVLMDDFNADNKKIDDAIKAVDNRLTTVAGGKADKSELDGLKQTVNSLSGTVSGHESSLNSHASSMTKLGNCQIHTQTYTGDGETSKSLTFPGYPAFVFVQVVGYAGSLTFIRDGECGAGDYGNNLVKPTWTSHGLSWKMSNGGSTAMNTRSTNYAVFALLDMSR